MRVTNQMLFEAQGQQIAAAREKMLEAQARVTTGVRVNHPGEDPAAAGVIVSHRMALERFDTIDQTIARAAEEAEVADGALQEVSTLIARARELAVQLGNDSYSNIERAGGALEIKTIMGQVTQLMNTQVAGRYIFGGNIDQTPPFDAVGTYSGDTNIRQVEVAPGLMQNQSVRADQALKGVGGGVDVYATLTALSNAMAANDGGGIRGTLTALESSVDQLASALTQTGGVLEGFRSARNIGSVAKLSAQTLLSAASEVDVFDAASELTRAQTSLEASLAVAAKSFNISLLDYMRG
jgi:flagellar hook-associated protein 3 FlgL